MGGTSSWAGHLTTYECELFCLYPELTDIEDNIHCNYIGVNFQAASYFQMLCWDGLTDPAAPRAVPESPPRLRHFVIYGGSLLPLAFFEEW